MNDSQRFDFDRCMNFIIRHMGDEVCRPIRFGMDYYRAIEAERGAMYGEITKLREELATLRASLPTQSIPSTIAGVNSGIESKDGDKALKSLKRDLHADWEPEPHHVKVDGNEHGVALVKDQDKITTKIMCSPVDSKTVPVVPVVAKGSIMGFLSKLFGG